MVKRNEFKKRSRYLAMLTALSLAFSNIGSCVNMVYAAETQEQEDGAAEEPEENNENAGEEEEAEENSGSEEENSGDDSENDSENDSEEGGSEEENAEDENSGDENGGDENSGEEGGNSEEDGEDSESGKDTGDSEDKDEKDAENHEEGESGKENGGQSGAEENGNFEAEEDSVSAGGSSSSGNSKSAVKEADEAKKGTYKLTYSVDPDEGAVVEGPSSVAAGKNAVFTVEAQEGYVIKNVSCDGGEISTVEDVDTASASNAQKKNAGKNDGEKFQAYQIENVTEDSEIIIEMDNEKGKLEVDILDGGKAKELIFQGNDWLSTSWEVSKAEVPSVVMETFRHSNFGKYRIDDIHFYETPNNSYYYFDLEQGNSEVHLSIDPTGNILQ